MALSLYPASFITATVLSAILTRLCIPLARRLRLVDRPGHRKTHTHSVAYLGGGALFGAITLTLLIALAACPEEICSSSGLWACLAASLAATVLGLVDDIRDVRARTKFFFQAAIALLFAFFAYRFEVLHLPGIKPFSLGWTSLPLTVFFILAITNGINMIDGSDGLCASASIASFTLLVAAASIAGQPDRALLVLTASGACLGFLLYNRAPARIYLGDAGSHGIGFLLACLLVSLGQPEARLPAFVGATRPAFQPFNYQAVLMVLLAGYPALEVTLSVFRRGLQGRNLFRGDQGHLHHRLSRLGLSASGVARCAAGLTLLSGSITIAFLLQEKGIAALLIVLLVGLLGLGLSQLDYTHFFRRRWLDERRPHYSVAHHFAAMQSARLLLAQNLHEALALVAQTCREFGVIKSRVGIRGRNSGRQPWAWRWVSSQDDKENVGTLERLRLDGVGSSAWVLGTISVEPELEMECRVLITEFMRKAVERIHVLYLKAKPEEAVIAAQVQSKAPSISWLKGRMKLSA